MRNQTFVRLLCGVVCVAVVSSYAYAASWRKTTRGGTGTLAAGEVVTTYYYPKGTPDNTAATLKHTEITTDVTYWFGLRDNSDNKVHQSTSRRFDNNYTYEHLVNANGLPDSIKYKAGKGAKGSYYRLAVQTDSNTAREAYYTVIDFYS